MLGILLMTHIALGSTIDDPIPDGFGRVCVLRQNRLILGVAIPFEVFINDILVGVLRDGKTLCVDVESESVVLSVVESAVPLFVAKAGFTNADSAALNGEYAIDKRRRGLTPRLVITEGELLIMEVKLWWWSGWWSDLITIATVSRDSAQELFFTPADPVDQYVTQIVVPRTPPPTRKFTDDGPNGATVLAPQGQAPLDPGAFEEESE